MTTDAMPFPMPMSGVIVIKMSRVLTHVVGAVKVSPEEHQRVQRKAKECLDRQVGSTPAASDFLNA